LEYFASVEWVRGAKDDFLKSRYSRGHKWTFDGGAVISASSSPHVVPLPFSVEENIDPEEAFVASLSSCHMLFFLSIAAKRKFVVDEYTDDAKGIMEKDSRGKFIMKKVILRPKVTFSGSTLPHKAEIEEMHSYAHDECYIANSVKTEVVTEMIF
jgi:organic hydroperoxide reductase OsmC/OhrA